MHLYRMDVYEYLKTGEVTLGAVAKRMYPGNKAAGSYLSKKIHGERPFTLEDAELAKRALIDLGKSFESIDIGTDYPKAATRPKVSKRNPRLPH